MKAAQRRLRVDPSDHGGPDDVSTNGARRGTPSGQVAFSGQFSENQIIARCRRRAPMSEPARRAAIRLPSLNTREESVASATPDAAQNASDTAKRVSIVIMIPLCGTYTELSTVHVPVEIFCRNGKLTDMDTMTDNTLDQILDRVRRRLNSLGLSEHAAEQAAGARVGTIRNWRRGALPRIDTLRLIAPALHTTPEWLAYEAGPEDLREQSKVHSSRFVPKISWVNAGSFAATDPVFDTDEFETIEVSGLPTGRWVALTVQGDSMDRISPPDSIVLVNLNDRRLVPNACYIVQDGHGGATYKRYRQSPVRFEPVSTNPVHEALFPDHDNMPTIFGRVGRSYIDM